MQKALTTGQVAKRWACDPLLIRRMCRSGQLKSFVLNPAAKRVEYRIPLSAVFSHENGQYGSTAVNQLS